MEKHKSDKVNLEQFIKHEIIQQVIHVILKLVILELVVLKLEVVIVKLLLVYQRTQVKLQVKPS
jgi:hypothetical protein